MGGVLIIHIDDLRRLAPFWLHKTEEVRADKAHWATNITGDMYQQGWISEMYGYSFGAAEVKIPITSTLALYCYFILQLHQKVQLLWLKLILVYVFVLLAMRLY